MSRKREYISPYVAGCLIGLLQCVAILAEDKMLGLSSAYMALSAKIFSVFSSVSDYSELARYMNTGSWSLSLSSGIALGSYISFLRRPFLAHTRSWRPSCLRAFFGGMILVFGARLAGGCTSGHGISGMSTLSMGSIVTVCTMFLSAIVIRLLAKGCGGR